MLCLSFLLYKMTRIIGLFHGIVMKLTGVILLEQCQARSRCSINATCRIPVTSWHSFLSYEGFWDWGQLGSLPKMT